MRSFKTLRLTVFAFALAVSSAGCSNIDLLAKLETPGGTQTSVRVVGTNITETLSSGGTFNAAVTFSEAVIIPSGAITINNGATVTSLASVDNIIWTFSLSGLVGSSYTVNFSSAISSPSGAKLVPFSITFTHTAL